MSRPTSPWSTASRAGGGMSPASRRAKARSIIGPCMPSRTPAIEARCGAWVRKHLAGYTGMLNLETIGGTIIEAHLRFADQWPDLYGAGWVEAVVGFTRTARGISPTPTAAKAIASCCSDRTAGAIAIRRRRWSMRSNACPASPACRSPSTKICAPERHAMPPGGFRLAIVNGFDLARRAGRARAAEGAFSRSASA